MQRLSILFIFNLILLFSIQGNGVNLLKSIYSISLSESSNDSSISLLKLDLNQEIEESDSNENINTPIFTNTTLPGSLKIVEKNHIFLNIFYFLNTPPPEL